MTRPVPLLLSCPRCDKRHVDRGVWATRPHSTHRCARCAFEWRPFAQATVGVSFFAWLRNVCGI